MIRFLQSGNKGAKYILGGFLIILAVSMVAYLIPGFLSSVDANSRAGVVASVAGEPISADQVAKLAQQMLQAQRIPEAYMSMLMPQASQQALQQLVQTQEMRYEAGRMGLKVSDAEVRDELQNGSLKQYFYPDGKWIGQQQYVNFLQREAQITPEVFEAQIRDQVLSRKLFSTITAGVNVTPAELEQAYKDKNLKVKFQYAILNLADIQKEINPTEVDLKAFYQANQGEYQNSIPEKRQLRYFVLLDKDAESKVTLGASEIQRYYNDNLDQYRLPDRVKVRHILISIPKPAPDGKADPKAVDEARAKAADVLKQLKAGGNFAELAKKYSQDPGSAGNGGELGWAQRGAYVPEFEKAAFALNPGQTSDLVQTSFGFHIIQGEEKDAARVKPLAEVKDEIEKNLKAQKTGTILDQQANVAQDTAQKQSLDKAAAQAGAKVVESNPIGLTDSLPGVGPSPELMASVFNTPKGPAQIQRFPQGYLIYEVTRIDPPRTPSFDEIKDRVTSDFKGQRARDLLQKKAQAMADRAHVEHDLAKAAKEAGATVKTSELVGHTSQVPEIGSMSSGAANSAFSLKPGEISGPISLGPKIAVLAVTDRQEASMTDPQFAHDRDALMEQLSDKKRQQALALFMSNLDTRLKNEHKKTINQAEMDRLLRTRG